MINDVNHNDRRRDMSLSTKHKWNESTSGQTENRIPTFRIDFSREVDDPVFSARFIHAFIK